MRAFRAGWAGLLSLCLFLSACGGGGDGGNDQSPVTPLPPNVSVNGESAADTGAPVQFSSDIATPEGGLRFEWDFGDGGSSTEAAPSHQFRSPGEYDVVLTVSNEDGETRTATFKVSARRYAIVRELMCSGASSQGWCWQHPQPSGNAIEDITFVDASTGWAVGDAGQIVKTTDGGTTWTPQVSNVTERLTHVRFANVNVGWVLGYGGTILRTTDSGASWHRQAAQASYPDTPEDPGLVVLDESRALAVIGGYQVRGTADGGETWSVSQLREASVVTDDGVVWQKDYYSLRKAGNLGVDEPTVSYDGYAQQQDVRLFTMGDPRSGLLHTYDWGTGASQLRRTSDAGASWPVINPKGLPPQLTSLKLFGTSAAWATAYTGLYRSVDGGSSWKAVALPDDVDEYEVTYNGHIVDARTFWFRHGVGHYLTTDGGAHWTWLRVEAESEPATELQVNAGGLWLTHGERIYRSRDVGGSWTQVFGMPVDDDTTELSAVWFFDAQKGLAVGTGGSVLETSDGGRHWARKALTDNSIGLYSRLQFISPSTGWMSGAWGVSKTSDGGATWWSPVANGGLVYPTDFHFVDAQHGWAISQTQLLFRTNDGGETWQQQGDLQYGWNSVRFINAQVGFVATANGLLRTEDGGATWRPRPTGVFQPLNRVAFFGPTIGWAVGDDGTVITSTDAGLTWTAVPVPTRQRLSDVVFADDLHGWIVGDEGTVLSTIDGGSSWTVQASGSAQSLRSAFFLDPYTGWVVGSGGAVLATATGGR